MKSLAALVLAVLLLPSKQAVGWEFHYLITRASLESASGFDSEVQVEPLEDFLRLEGGGISGLFAAYYDWLAAKGSVRFNRMPFNPNLPTIPAFLKAARLNPDLQLRYLRRSPPGEVEKSPEIPFEKYVALYDKQLKGLTYNFTEIPKHGSRLPGLEVIATASDEPDWGLDNDLWQHTEYGYGERPYGDAEGLSNAAAFHCEYRHENLLVRMMAPETTHGMAHERLELFSRLAEFAYRRGHEYWAHRFAGWALHYLQDISQPYHAVALPFAGPGYYLRFAFARNKKQFVADSTQLLVNHHDLYEQSAAVLLDRGFAARSGVTSALKASYPQSRHSAVDVQDLFARTSAWSAKHAKEIDRILVKVFGPKMTLDPSYSFRGDPNYAGCVSLLGLSPESLHALEHEVNQNFQVTGEATRKLVELVKGAR